MLGNVLINMMIGGFLFLYFLGRVVRTVDDDGEIKKTTCDGLAKCIERLFK